MYNSELYVIKPVCACLCVRVFLCVCDGQTGAAGRASFHRAVQLARPLFQADSRSDGLRKRQEIRFFLTKPDISLKEKLPAVQFEFNTECLA